MSRQSDKFWNRQLARNFLLWGALLLLAQRPALADQSVVLTWNPSPDANVAGYKIYYGGACRVYTNSVTLGAVTNVIISGLSEGATYYFGATTLDAAGDESAFSNEAIYAIPQTVSNPPPATVILPVVVNQPPTLAAITNLTVYQNARLQTVLLAGITSGSTNENQLLLVSAVSSNPGIIPAPAVNYTSPNTSGSLTFAPTTNALGKVTLTVTVNDGGASNNLVTQTFTVTVVTVVPAPVVNQPPTLNPIANLTLSQNAGAQTITLTGITSGSSTEKQVLTVRASSSNPGLVPAPTIRYASPASTAQLLLKPAAKAAGVATITVMVNDGGKSNNLVQQSFTVTVTAPASRLSGLSVPANVVANTNQAATLTTVATPPGQFGFRVTGVTGGQYVVQATSDFVHWTSVQTNTAPFTFQDQSAPGAGQRFYRTYYVQ